MLSHESALFQMRLEWESPAAVSQFLKDNHLQYEELVLGSEEHNAVRQQLEATFKSVNPASKGAEVTSYFKVPFEEALELVRCIYLYVCIYVCM